MGGKERVGDNFNYLYVWFKRGEGENFNCKRVWFKKGVRGMIKQNYLFILII
jgi:hypothetical protein